MVTKLKMSLVYLYTLEDGSSFMSKFSFTYTNKRGYSNNSIEINTLECVEKEDFAFDKLDTCHATETESNAGRVGA